MSKKILRPLAAIAVIGLTVFSGGLGLGAVAILGMKVGVATLLATGIGLAAGILLKPKAPQVSSSVSDRLNANLVPDAPRKIVFGRTAMATDIRYQGFTGTDQEYCHWIMAVASHAVEAIEEIWFDTTLAWSATGGVASKYAGYLQVTPRLVGTSGNGIAIDSVWTSACTLTGCAYVHLRFKLTGNDKKAESPFAQSIPTRVTVVGKGAFLPDLREPGTNVATQSTWDWFDEDSARNPAMQLLFYLLGWKINGKVAVGRGMPPSRVDLDSFIAAANMCDEPVSLAAGGTQPRYRSDGIFSEGDDPSTVIGSLCAAMNAVLRDTGGKIGVYILHDDLASPVASFTEADIIGDDDWEQTPPVDEVNNLVRGRYIDATSTGLYQFVDYPEIEIESVDGIDRIEQFDLPCVQSAIQAQRLAKSRLQRNLYRGVFSARFSYRAWQVSLGDPVRLSHAALGFSAKSFRVAGQSISLDGSCYLILQEEHQSIYAWDEEEEAAVVAAEVTSYDPLHSPLIKSLDELAIDIASLGASIDAAADDNILSRGEKIKFVADVELLHQRADTVAARATALGVPTAAMTAARAAFEAYLAGLPGAAWNDTSADTALIVNPLPAATFPNGAGWVFNADYTHLAPYHRLGDSSNVGWSLLDATIPATAGQTWTATLAIKKDAIGRATRFPILRVVTNAGQQIDLGIDTATGEFALAGPSAPVAAGVLDNGSEEWLADIIFTAAPGTTSVSFIIYPAVGQGAGWGYNSTSVGSFDCRAPTLTLGNLDSAGREVFRYRLYTYQAEIEALAKAISEQDSYRADVLVPPPTQNIAYDYLGESTAQLPKVLQFQVKRGDADITADSTFGFTIVGGTIDTTGVAAGQVKLSTMTADTAVITATAQPPSGAPPKIATVTAIKKPAAAPPPSSGGGGGGAPTSFTASVAASISDASFDGSPQRLFDPVQVRTDASGNLKLSLNVSYEVGPGQSGALTAKFRKSTDNSSYTDISGASGTGSTATGGYFTGSPPYGYDDWVEGAPGALSISSSFAIGTPNTDYWIDAIGHRGSGSNLAPSGIAAGQQP